MAPPPPPPSSHRRRHDPAPRSGSQRSDPVWRSSDAAAASPPRPHATLPDTPPPPPPLPSPAVARTDSSRPARFFLPRLSPTRSLRETWRGQRWISARFWIRSSSPHILETRVIQNRPAQEGRMMEIPQARRDGDLPNPELMFITTSSPLFSSARQ
nr:wiskott-Aldrich syndrome protein homolog [Equus asinus]